MGETLTSYSGWALVEQMGFRKTVGKVCEVEQYGTKMLRIDIPISDGATSCNVGPHPDSADEVYCSTCKTSWAKSLNVHGCTKEGNPEAFTTRFCGGPSIYQVTPLSEAVALNMVKSQGDARPVRPTDYRIEDKRPARGNADDEFDPDPDTDEDCAA